MQAPKLLVFAAAAVLCAGMPLRAQRTAAEDRGGGGGVTDRGSDLGGAVTSRGTPAGDAGVGSAPLGRADIGGSLAGSFGRPVAGALGVSDPTPRLQGTSWLSANSYFQWSSFLYQLQSRYLLDGSYFMRFTRNVEPLVTPQMLRLALNEPLANSRRLAQEAGDLETLVAALQSGNAGAGADAVAAKAREIRKLARKIRQDPSLGYVDRRVAPPAEARNGTEGGLDAARRLHRLAVDLHAQLEGMYAQKTTSTVSVQSLVQPSFETLSRDIERLAKTVESAARRS